MVDQTEFRRLVGEALAHLYEPAYLLVHPLTRLLIERQLISSPEQLPRYLTAIIDELRPRGIVPRNAPGWRQYRYLYLRYVEGAGHRQIAADLGLSTRQATREHEAGLRAFSSVLWNRYLAAAKSPTVVESAVGSGDVALGAAELVDLGALQPIEPIDLKDVVGLAVSTLGRAAEGAGVRLRARIGDRITTVAANRLVLRHILLNLLGDLIQRGAPGALLEIAATERPGAIDLLLSLDRARQGDPVANGARDGRSGIGLAYRLAAIQGMPFNVRASQSSIEAVLTLPTRHARTVLYVDDNPEMGRLFRQYLIGTGYSLVHVRTADRAVQVARSVPPDVVVLDVILPTEDGWQLLERLRADQTTAKIPIIMCSILPEETLAASMGVVEFLTKPISQAALLSALARCCPVD
jgi:CheY-like chemotaxis protein